MKRSVLQVVVASASVAALAMSAVGLHAEEPSLPTPLPDEFVSIDENVRFIPSTQPEQPSPQKPPLSTEKNVDTNRPPHEWQRLTDDWFGIRPKLEDRGVSLNGSFTGDVFRNLRGGLNTEDTDFAHLTNVNLTLDTERLFGLHGGTFFVNYQHAGGDDPLDSVGAFLPVSSIANDRTDQISEIWYEQTFGEQDIFRVKLGKIDANTEFANSDLGGEFINDGSGKPPTLPGFTTFPDTAFGGVVEVKVGEHVYVRGGAFDGSMQEGKTTGDDGPRSLWNGPADMLYAAEVGADWTLAKRKGHAAIGAVYHTGTFEAFDGGTEDGSAGFYAIVDHQITRENPDDEDDEQGLAGFVHFGVDDSDTNEARYHAATGLLYTGVIPDRDYDKVGIAVNWVNFSPDADSFDGGDELVFEAIYKLQVTHYLTISPDVQYIHNVGGDEDLDDAIVAGVRFDVQF